MPSNGPARFASFDVKDALPATIKGTDSQNLPLHDASCVPTTVFEDDPKLGQVIA